MEFVVQQPIPHISPRASSHVYIDAVVPRWFAVKVPFRREKSAVQRLERRGIEAYVPLVSKTKRYGRKVKKYELPLIGQYIFVRIVESEYLKVLQERDVFDFLRFNKKLIAIPQQEMDTLKLVVGDESVQLLDWTEVDWMNKNVEIIHGQLTGVKGRVVELKNKKSVVVNLDTLGVSMRLEVPAQYLHPIA